MKIIQVKGYINENSCFNDRNYQPETIGRCSCGWVITLHEQFVNTCLKCGKNYNSIGDEVQAGDQTFEVDH